MNLADFILKNNYFEFENNICRQKLGTTIGTKFFPSFANLFIYKLESKMVKEYHLDPFIWWRFLDNVFMIWLHEKENLKEFFIYVNIYDPTIKFTWEWSNKEFPFLDVIARLKNNKLSNDIHTKPTDTHQYLNHKSCHMSRVKRGIPYGQALRLRRICETDKLFGERHKGMKRDFIKRAYKEKFLDSQFEKTKEKSRDSLLSRDVKSGHIKGFKIPLILNFHPAFSEARSIIDSLWPKLHASEDMKKVFGERSMVTYRRPKTLQDELVRAKLKGESNESRGMKKRGKRCQICNYVEEGCIFEERGRSYHVNFSFDCDSLGVIYLIRCRKCRKIYVGSTITSFRTRFNNHKGSLNRFSKKQRLIPGEHLYAYFCEPEHKSLEEMQIKIIDKADISNPTEREGFWAYKLDTFIPPGFNIRDFM